MTVIDTVPIEGMTRQDFIQLEFYIQEMKRRNEYYGRRDYFDNRHKKLEAWIDRTLTYIAGEKIKGKDET